MRSASAAPALSKPSQSSKGRQRERDARDRASQHLFEIDLVRVVTAICVVGVHATYFTLFFNASPVGYAIQNAGVAALHFTREVFLSITAFVMVYVYANRPFPPLTFWRKRGLGVLLPYILWSLLYAWLGVPHNPPEAWLRTTLVDIVTGTASFQLYFILLSLEFYVVLPWFLWVVKGVGRQHPWRLLIGSAVLQAIVLYLDYNYVQAGPFAGTSLGKLVNQYQASFLPLYQFYALIGGVAAIHAGRLGPFVARHGRFVVVAMLLGLAALWGRYGVAVALQHQDSDFATSVLQPVMVVYSTAVALFLYWLGVKWASSRLPGPPRWQRFMSLLSDASFGVYLIHPLFLMPILANVAPRLSPSIPVAIRVLAVWGLAAALTMAACILILQIPMASRLIGRSSGGAIADFWSRLLSPAAPPAPRRLASRRPTR